MGGGAGAFGVPSNGVIHEEDEDNDTQSDAPARRKQQSRVAAKPSAKASSERQKESAYQFDNRLEMLRQINKEVDHGRQKSNIGHATKNKEKN